MATIGSAPKVEKTVNGLLDLAVTDKGEPIMVEGIEELQQAIVIRMMKRQGEDPFEPDMGMPWNEIIRLGRDEFLAGATIRNLTGERRLAGVRNVRVDPVPDEPRARFVSIQATARSGEHLTVTEAFGV